MARYVVIDGSQTSHCCFEATVVDTTKVVTPACGEYPAVFEEVCECLDWADAQIIVAALNACAG